MRSGRFALRFAQPALPLALAVNRFSVRVASESKRTVYVAICANLAIGVAKAVAGVLSGSSVMLAEAAHSAADTMNEVFMLVSLRLGKRQPDKLHPFGYGKERFFWAFVAAVFMFVASASFSVAKGVHEIVSGDHADYTDTWLEASFVVLGVAALAEGASFLRARSQVTKQAARVSMPIRSFVWQSKDPTVKVVLLEDAAALIGLAIAALGIALSWLTRNPLWDGVASILVGLLLAAVALGLGADTKGLLLGESALPADRDKIERLIEQHSGVRQVVQVLTMATGPDSLLVAARVSLCPGLSAEQIERIAHEIDCRLREEVPGITEVFLDPTSQRERAH